MGNFFLDLLFPIQCLGCSRDGEYLCSDCLNRIPLNKEIFYLRNLRLLAAARYDNPLIKKIIYCYKYDFVKELAKPLGFLMAQKLDPIQEAVLVPVPLRPRRLRWRGFNQAELLAIEIGRRLNLPVADCLFRTRYTPPQMKIQDARERKINVQNAFRLKYRPKGKIILIDDVATTGATLEECAKLFSEEVWGLTAARG